MLTKQLEIIFIQCLSMVLVIVSTCIHSLLELFLNDKLSESLSFKPHNQNNYDGMHEITYSK